MCTETRQIAVRSIGAGIGGRDSASAPVLSRAMDSRVICTVAYDAIRSELTVTFTSGRTYAYWLVPERVVEALLGAASPGAYFNLHIRDRYPFRRTKVAGAASPLSLREALKASRLA